MSYILYASPASPYARTCSIAVLELGLSGQVDIVMVNPMEDPVELRARNPLGLVPCLDRGRDAPAVMDSLAIIYALDAMAETTHLPQRGEALVAERRLWGLAQGVLDACLRRTQEMRRSETQRSVMWLERWHRAIIGAFGQLEREVGTLNGASPAHWHLGVALDYVDFRYPELNWKEVHSALADYQARMAKRDSFTATAPQG